MVVGIFMDCGLLCQQIGEKLSRDLNKMSKFGGGKELIHIQVFLKTDEETMAFFIMIYEYLWFDLIANEKT